MAEILVYVLFAIPAILLTWYVRHRNKKDFTPLPTICLGAILVFLSTIPASRVAPDYYSAEKKARIAKERKERNETYDEEFLKQSKAQRQKEEMLVVRRAVKTWFKENLRDYSSFEEISRKETQKENGTYVVVVRYRAKNGFGGYNVETMGFDVDVQGKNYNIDAVKLQ